MGLRDRLLGWLARGEDPEPGHPDDIVEVANEALSDGPRLVALLGDQGIRATWIEATTDALHSSALTRARIFARRGDAARAVELLEADRVERR